MIPRLRRLGTESPAQVGAGAEHLARAGDDDAADAVVEVEESEGFFELFGHCGLREGIVFLWAVEGEDQNRGWGRGGCGVVGDLDLGVGEGGVGVWERGVALVWGHGD